MPCNHSWASASVKLTPALAFRHLSSQSGIAVKKCQTETFYSGTGSVPASLVFLSPVPDWLDAGQSGIPVVSIAVVSIVEVSIAVVSIAKISIAVVSIAVVSIAAVSIAIVSIAVVSMAVVSMVVVSMAVVSIAVVSIAVVSIAAVSIVEPHHVMRLQCSNLQLSCGYSPACHAAPVRHVMRLQSGIAVVSIALPVVSIAVVSIAAVGIAEPHDVMQLHCWIGLKWKYLFCIYLLFIRIIYLLVFLRKKLKKIFLFYRKILRKYSIWNSGTNWMCIQIRNNGGWYLKIIWKKFSF
jgi:hypothetical protein